MELSIQTALLHVTDLKRSIEFYQDVFGLRLTSEQEEVAILMVSETKRRQVLLLRELRGSSHHSGRRTIGLRMLSFEIGAPNELDDIERKLTERHALVWRAETGTYRAIMGVDPDRIDICVASSLTGTPISTEDWENVDDAIYAIE